MDSGIAATFADDGDHSVSCKTGLESAYFHFYADASTYAMASISTMTPCSERIV
jgi:hypothetical protein